MNYTLHQLQIFIKIAETESITKAAAELHLTQPAVSIQLKKFQDQFDIPLTEVIGRKLYITEFGKEIIHSIKHILDEAEAIQYKTQAFRGHLVGKLNLAVVSTGKYVMPYFLSGFLKAHSEIDLIMDVTNKGSVVHSLSKNEVDFALVSLLPKNLSLEKEELMQNRLYLVGNQIPQDLSTKSPKEIFESIPLIFREKGSATREMMELFINEHAIEVRKKIELTSNEAVKQAVLAGLGYSVMPLIGIKNELMNKELYIIPVNGLSIMTHWNLVRLKQKKLSPVAQSFLDYIQMQKESIIHQQFNWYENY